MSLLKNVKPTRGTLNDLKTDEVFIHKAISLLDEKLHVLNKKFRETFANSEKIRNELEAKISEGYKKLSLANMQMGFDGVDQVAETSQIQAEVEIFEKSYMGIVIPEINLIETKNDLPDFGIFRTSIYLDVAQKRFSEILSLTIQLAGYENSAYKLLLELQKTQKRLNALEHILIPDYKKTIRHLDDILEEIDRDDIIAVKISKDLLLKKQQSKLIR